MTPETFRLILMLTRVCISEGGFDGHEECTVIVHALVHQAAARDMPLRTQICLYAPNSCNRSREDSRRWISFLSPELASRPPGFPSQLSWSEYRPQVTAMWLVAYRAYLGVLENPCPGALHWGSRGCGACRRRMREAGYVRTSCEVAANHWWARPVEPEIIPEPVLCQVN